MRPLTLSLLLLFTACYSNPIESCPTDEVDCCEEDKDCAEYYGTDLSVCLNPGALGICGECRDELDCESGQTCVVFDEGSYCEAT